MQVIYASRGDAQNKAGGKPRAIVPWAAVRGSSLPYPSDDRSATEAPRSPLLVPVLLVSGAGELIQLEIILEKKKNKETKKGGFGEI